MNTDWYKIIFIDDNGMVGMVGMLFANRNIDLDGLRGCQISSKMAI